MRHTNTTSLQPIFAALLTLIVAQAPRAASGAIPNPHAKQDMDTVRNRPDVVHLPDPLKNRLVELAGRPHNALPTVAFAEGSPYGSSFAPVPSQLFQYYLLDTTGFEPNPFTRDCRRQRPGDADGHRPQLRPADHRRRAPSCSSPSPACRPIRTTSARSSTSSPTSPACSSSTTRAAGTRAG